MNKHSKKSVYYEGGESMAFRLFLLLKVIYCSGDEEVHKTRSEEKSSEAPASCIHSTESDPGC